MLSGAALVTTDHVLVETWLFLRHRLGRHAAEGFWRSLRHGAARVESVGPADLDVAWEVGTAFADQDFSLVDGTSFAVMRRLGLVRVASFDDRFAVVRFGPGGQQVFDVLR